MNQLVLTGSIRKKTRLHSTLFTTQLGLNTSFQSFNVSMDLCHKDEKKNVNIDSFRFFYDAFDAYHRVISIQPQCTLCASSWNVTRFLVLRVPK